MYIYKNAYRKVKNIFVIGITLDNYIYDYTNK